MLVTRLYLRSLISECERIEGSFDKHSATNVSISIAWLCKSTPG